MVQPSEKSYGTAVCFAGVLGLLGLQHFYLGRYLLGFVDLGLSVGGVAFIFLSDSIAGIIFGVILLGIDFVHAIYVFVKLLAGEYEDGDSRLVMYPGQKTRPDHII